MKLPKYFKGVQVKNLYKTVAMGAIITLFAGCGGHMVEVGKLPKKTDMIADIKIEAPKALFQAEARNKANILAIEAAAKSTIKNGYRYFSIDLPKGAVSNTHGSLVHSAKDYIKTCNTNSTGKEIGASLLTLGMFSVTLPDSCHIASKAGDGKGWLRIYAFKTQPLNYTSYDAKAVIKYLKDNKMYINIPKGEFAETIIKK